jgi:hypothetical protein
MPSLSTKIPVNHGTAPVQHSLLPVDCDSVSGTNTRGATLSSRSRASFYASDSLLFVLSQSAVMFAPLD